MSRICALDENEAIGNMSLFTQKGLVFAHFCIECMRNGRGGRHLLELQEDLVRGENNPDLDGQRMEANSL